MKSKPKANGKVKVRKLASDHPQARDEGPRLLPLDGVERTVTFGRSTDLADVALGRGKPSKSTATDRDHPSKSKRPRETRHA